MAAGFGPNPWADSIRLGVHCTGASETDAEPEALLDADATWRYLDDGTDPSNGLPSRTDWAAPEFDDSDWSEAAGSFGALRGQLTELSGGYLPDNLLNQYYEGTTDNIEAFFFRSDFTVNTPTTSTTMR